MLIKKKEGYEIYEKKSEISGKGIYTSGNLKKDQLVDILEGRCFEWEYKEPRDRIIGANWIGAGKNLWIDPEFPFSHINHSCNPNLGLKNIREFYALRDISAGEELTFDYAIAEEVLSWQLDCNCLNENCRKLISGIQVLPLETYNRYLPYIPEYFQKIYMDYNKIK